MENPQTEWKVSAKSSEIGNALAELRAEYLNDLQNKRVSKMLRINTRYVSSVSIGYRMKNTTPHSRYEPYKYTNERHRTKSENFEAEEKLLMKNFDILDTYKEEVNQLKRAKSLESIVAEGNQIIDLKNINMNKINELEVVSSSIQNLKVAE